MVKRYETLVEMVAEARPKIIMEVGTWVGDTAIKMINASGAEKYIGFDLFTRAPVEEFSRDKVPNHVTTTQKHIEDNTSGCEIVLVKGNTRDTLKGEYPSPDFVFIDGGHSLTTIASDWENVSRLMHKDTVVVFDDYYSNDTSKGCKPLVDSLVGYDVEIINPPDRFDVIIHLVRVKRCE